MNKLDKTVRIGTTDVGNGRMVSVYCRIKYNEGKLSISGVEGPLKNGEALGSCGQIDMHLTADNVDPAENWDKEKISKFLQIWGEWHLNDMNAGSPAQTAHLKQFARDAYREAGFSSYYDWAKTELETAGLQPDTSHPKDGAAYSYGSAWLSVNVPKDVLTFLSGLPDTDKTPAWV